MSTFRRHLRYFYFSSY